MIVRTLLLVTVMSGVVTANAQKNKTVTGYAITGAQKLQSGGWKEVRLMDMSTGQPIQDIYKSGGAPGEVFNARTGAKIEVKEEEVAAKSYTVTYDAAGVNGAAGDKRMVVVRRINDNGTVTTAPVEISGLAVTSKDNNVTINVPAEVSRRSNRTVVRMGGQHSKHPFATSSAACAYDKKHDRLYYTPMGINQLRYIDLKSNKIYYFENEAFGVVAGSWDTDNHITRMTFASDKNGYALSNNGNHLIRFTTGKKPEITDLGALTDDAANGQRSVHNRHIYGGDMIADASGNLYLIGANRAVFKIDIATKVAAYKGLIKGLPEGFSTNGAMVHEGSKVIVSSSLNNFGYFVFDLNTLQAERFSAAGEVYAAADLANGVLARIKENKEEQVVTEEKPIVTEAVTAKKVTPQDVTAGNGITVFPNPVTERLVKLSFANQPMGKYSVQLVDINGQMVFTQEINIGSKTQVEEIRLPELITRGTYLVRVLGIGNGVNSVNKIVVQ